MRWLLFRRWRLNDWNVGMWQLVRLSGEVAFGGVGSLLPWVEGLTTRCLFNLLALHDWLGLGLLTSGLLRA